MLNPIEILSLSSGTMGTVTGLRQYAEIEKIQFAFYSWIIEQKREFRNWPEAWNTFKEEAN